MPSLHSSLEYFNDSLKLWTHFSQLNGYKQQKDESVKNKKLLISERLFCLTGIIRIGLISLSCVKYVSKKLAFQGLILIQI